MVYRYLVYELIVETTFPCALLPSAPPDAPIDVTVVEGEVPRYLDKYTASDISWDAAPGLFLLRGGDKAGRFLVEDGQRITLQRNAGAEDARLAVHFYVSVLTALMQQRELLVLHANTAMTKHGAVAICGESGAGKTTAVAGVLASGHKLVADDITVLRSRNDGIIEVLPGAPLLHLCEDTAQQFGFNIEGLPRYPWRRMKVAVPVPEIMAESPVPLHAIFLLKTGSDSLVAARQLGGVEKFNVLQECIYGPLLPDGHKRVFSLFAKVMEQVPIYLLSRPQNRWSLDEVVETILHG